MGFGAIKSGKIITRDAAATEVAAAVSRAVGDDLVVDERALMPVPVKRETAVEPATPRKAPANPAQLVARLNELNVARIDDPDGIAALVPGDAFEENAPVVWEERPKADRAEAAEIKRFLETVLDMCRRSNLTHEEAVILVRQQPAQDWPCLSQGGRKANGDRRCLRNFQNWLKKITGDDGKIDFTGWQDALCKKYKRGKRPLKGHPVFWQIAIGLYLDEKQRYVTSCHRVARKLFKKLYPIHGADDIPSARQLRYWLAQPQVKAAADLMRRGADFFAQHYVDHVERDTSSLAVMDCIVLDHRKLDLWARAKNEKTGEWVATRCWFSGAQDLRSRKLLGKVHGSLPPNADIVALSLMHACHGAGNRVPRSVYIDNGKDYRAQGVFLPYIARPNADSRTEHEHSILIELGMRLLVAQPYNASAKHIERFYRDMAMEHDKLYPSYCGNKPANRPSDAEEFRGDVNRLPTVDEVALIFEDWLQDYETRPSRAEGLDGRSRQEVFDAGIGDAAPWDEAALQAAFRRPVAVVKVGRGGLIRHDGARYICENATLLKGEKVLVKVDIRSNAALYIHRLDGGWIGEAWRKDKVHALDDGEAAAKHNQHANSVAVDHARVAILDNLGGIVVGAPTTGYIEPLTGVEFKPLSPAEQATHDDAQAAKKNPPAPRPQAADPSTTAALDKYLGDAAPEPTAADDDDFTANDAMDKWLNG